MSYSKSGQSEPVEDDAFVFPFLDFANRFISSQSSLNKASFFFLDQPFNCFSHAMASLMYLKVSQYFNTTGLLV